MALLQRMQKKGVFLRKPMAPGIDRCIRISFGLPHEIDHFENVLPLALAEA